MAATELVSQSVAGSYLGLLSAVRRVVLVVHLMWPLVDAICVESCRADYEP